MKPIEIRGHLLLAGTNATEISRQLGVSRQAVHQTINNLNASPRIRLAIVQAIGKEVSELWPNLKAYSKSTKASYQKIITSSKQEGCNVAEQPPPDEE
jgi:lambda repressor-like predicted transcriptional regulator